MRYSLLFVAALSGGCSDNDTSYSVDGVTITREDGSGPREVEMVLTTEVYRREAAETWQLDSTVEQVLWKSLRGINWTDDAVPGGGYYRNESIRLTWTGCAVDSPLYELLTRHYFGLLLGSERRDWAIQLGIQYQFLCDGHGALNQLLDNAEISTESDDDEETDDWAR